MVVCISYTFFENPDESFGDSARAWVSDSCRTIETLRGYFFFLKPKIDPVAIPMVAT